MKVFLVGAVLLLAAGLPARAGIAVQAWGEVGGKSVELFTLTNDRANAGGTEQSETLD